MENLIEHFQRMNNLDGYAIEYPLMLIVYLGVFLFSFICNVMLYVSNNGNRVVWLKDQHKVIKSKFSYTAMLACTFTGVYLVGSFPLELQNTFGTWNADLFYTLGQSAIMITAGIYSLATYKKRSSVILNSLSIIVGLSTSIPMAALTILAPLDISNEALRVGSILAIIVIFVGLAALSVKYDLLVRYSRLNINLFIITTIALFTTINAFSSEGIDTSKILPFQGMISAEPWQELLSNPYWWYFEATVVSWAIFCGRFIAYCSNGYKIKEIIKYGTISLIILTVIWHLVSASTGYTLSFSRGWVIYTLTALTMIGFAVTSLDSASKTLLDDVSRNLVNHKIGQKPNVILLLIMIGLGIINIIILYTGSSKLFTILFSLIFIPYLIKAILYSIRFALGKINFDLSGTITQKEYEEISGEKTEEGDYRRIIS